MANPQQPSEPSGSLFPLTRWTVVQRMGNGEAALRITAWEEFCESYWPPIHAWFKTRGVDPATAEDFAQDFFVKIHGKPLTIQDLLFGFDGRAHLTLRDAKGNVIHTLRTAGYGVNGRLIPGAKHDRLETWTGAIPAATAQRVKTIDFTATPSAGKLQTRVEDNQRRFKRDVDALKSGLSTGLKALDDMFSLTPPND